VKHFSFDRRAFDHFPLGPVEPIEPGRQQGLDRRRHSDVREGFVRNPVPVLAPK
jgi:hypothetical protein